MLILRHRNTDNNYILLHQNTEYVNIQSNAPKDWKHWHSNALKHTLMCWQIEKAGILMCWNTNYISNLTYWNTDNANILWHWNTNRVDAHTQFSQYNTNCHSLNSAGIWWGGGGGGREKERKKGSSLTQPYFRLRQISFRIKPKLSEATSIKLSADIPSISSFKSHVKAQRQMVKALSISSPICLKQPPSTIRDTSTCFLIQVLSENSKTTSLKLSETPLPVSLFKSCLKTLKQPPSNYQRHLYLFPYSSLVWKHTCSKRQWISFCIVWINLQD